METKTKEERILYEKLYDKFRPTSFEKIKEVLNQARDDFFEMKQTQYIPSWVAEWFIKWFGAKPLDDTVNKI